MGILKQCIMYNSVCFKNTGISSKTGIVVHSTGANNPQLKRYVQPDEKNYFRERILNDIGVNRNGNDWNHSNRKAGVHAFIGLNVNGVVETYQVLPYDKDAWGVGKGKKGSYNYAPNARIQFEICEDGLDDPEYFKAVMSEAQDYCYHLCRIYDWTADRICSHKEAYDQGFASSNHGDIDHWLSKFGKDMDWFRAGVQKRL